MESVGEKLKSVRESRYCTIEQAANDTHISRRFLQALEEEDFSSLPGDSYVVGFLRSYSEYLGIDAESMVSLYRNLKLQEQPAPLQELIVRTGLPGGVKLLLVLVFAGVLALGIWLLAYNGREDNGQSGPEVVRVEDSKTPEPDMVLFNSPSMARNFNEGQGIRLVLDGQERDFRFVLREGQAHLDMGDVSVALDQAKTTPVDLDNDSRMDLNILVTQVDTQKAPAVFTVALDRILDAPSSLSSPLQAEIGGKDQVGLGTTRLAGRQKAPRSFPEYPLLGEILVRMQFDSPVVFRYEVDGANRVERMSEAGEQLNLVAKDSLRLWIANAGRVKLYLGSRQVELGSEGELVAWELSRSPVNNGQVSLSPMY